MTGPKILTLDIETSPALVYTFQMWNANISPGAVVAPTRMLCFAAKWGDSDKIIYRSEFHNGPGMMVQEAHRLLDEADVVVTYNGDKFDLPHLHREFMLLGFKPPSPYVSVDLYKVVKKNTVWVSHKLGYVTEQLGLSGKLEHQGFQMWVGCLNGDSKAWNLMRKYNKQDVVTTEELFKELLPYITNMPSHALYREDGDSGEPTCPNCGSTDAQRRGTTMTKTRRYARYQCQNCGKWFRGNRSELGVTAS